MKNLREYICENKKYTLFPKNRGELEKMIETEMRKNGNRCNLNHIDVSSIKDFSNLFNERGGGIKNFNGDISEWDVSNVKYMTNMFKNNQSFNGDISEWDVSNVIEVDGMFENSIFTGDLSKWKWKSIKQVFHVFHNSKIQKLKTDSEKLPEEWWNGEYRGHVGYLMGED